MLGLLWDTAWGETDGGRNKQRVAHFSVHLSHTRSMTDALVMTFCDETWYWLTLCPFFRKRLQKEGVIRLRKSQIFPSAIEHAFIFHSVPSFKCISSIKLKLQNILKCFGILAPIKGLNRHAWESFLQKIFKQSFQSSLIPTVLFHEKGTNSSSSPLC